RSRIGGVRRVSRTVRGILDARRPPWELIDPFSKELVRVLTPILERSRYDVLLAVNEAVEVTSILGRRGVLPPRVVVDWIDAPSLLYERRIKALPPTRAWIARFRTERLIAWQRRVNAVADAAIYIAEVDRAHARAADNPRVHVIPNGVLPRDPGLERRDTGTPTIGFLGNMGYRPNVHAAIRLHDKIFGPLAARRPDLRLKIIGRNPDESLRRLASPRVEITGEVESIWPHLAEVDIVVFPMEFGGGLQNKVLESAEAGCAVVVSHMGAAGIGADGMGALIIEDSDEGMVQAVSALLDDPPALRAAQKRAAQIRGLFDWKDILPRYASVVLGS
ncbi:MAG: glycosyltransferase family 4 protein, partial [Longimicrobiales bacterium]